MFYGSVLQVLPKQERHHFDTYCLLDQKEKPAFVSRLSLLLAWPNGKETCNVTKNTASPGTPRQALLRLVDKLMYQTVRPEKRDNLNWDVYGEGSGHSGQTTYTFDALNNREIY